MQQSTDRKAFRKHAVIGPGGWKCSCCTPAPAGRKMRVFFRIWKKRERDIATRDIQDQLNGKEIV